MNKTIKSIFPKVNQNKLFNIYKHNMCALCRKIYNYSTNKLFGPTNLCTDNIKPVLWVCGILAREKLINLIGYFSNNFSLISIAIG